MIKKMVFILLISFSLFSCTSTLNEINEKAKGDGIPYVPGI